MLHKYENIIEQTHASSVHLHNNVLTKPGEKGGQRERGFRQYCVKHVNLAQIRVKCDVWNNCTPDWGSVGDKGSGEERGGKF